jgi:hypothetical protein
MMDRRNLKSWIFAFVAVAGALPILFLPNLLLAGPQPLGDQPVVFVKTVCTVAAIAWAAVFAVIGFRRAEEFSQERSKFAWYWGSMVGLVAGTPLLVFVGLGGLHWPSRPGSADTQLGHAFALGAGLVLFAQVLGFAVVSIWWRATRR